MAVAVQACPIVDPDHERGSNERCILLVKSKKRQNPNMPPAYRQRPWGLPGGKNHEGETLERTLSRELYEELGLQGENFYYLRRSTTGKHKPVVFEKVTFNTHRHGKIDLKGLEIIIRDPAALRLDKRENTELMWVSWADLHNPNHEIGFDSITQFASIVIRRLNAEGKFGPPPDL
jgi:8-oxo-dGTP pyrophosphatase MutT (NUDIX family)